MSDFNLDEAVEDAEFDNFDGFDDENEESNIVDDDAESVEGVIVEADEHDAELYTVSDDELSREDAQELTENIRSTGEVLYVLVSRAHAGKAHKALGYSSFESYVKEEFGMSRSRAYQLIGQANVIQEITNAVPEGTEISISEAAARDLKGVLDKVVPTIADQTSGLSPDEASGVVDDIVNENRKKSDESLDFELSDEDIDQLLNQDLFGDSGMSFDEELMGDLQDRDGFSASSGGNPMGNGGGSGGQSGEVTSDFSDFSGFDDDFDFSEFDAGDEESDSDVNYDAVYDFFSFLRSIGTWPEPSALIGKIADARKQQVSESLPPALEWLTEFNELWEKAKSEDTGGDDGDE